MHDVFDIKISREKSVITEQLRYPDKLRGMPPSYIVNEYEIRRATPVYKTYESKGYQVTCYGYEIEVKVDIDWDLLKYVRGKWLENEAYKYDAFQSGSSKLAIGCRSFTYNDDKLKLLKWEKYRSALLSLIHDDRIHELALWFCYKWLSMVRRYFSKGEHVKKYVAEHESSHPVKDYTWGQLLKYGWLDVFLDYTKDIIDLWHDEFFTEGDWCLSPETYRRGFRSRSPGDLMAVFMIFVLWRSRKIGYNPGPSSCLAGVEHIVQVSFVREVMDKFESLLGCDIYSPKTEGGKVYNIISDAIVAGKPVAHYDVAGMEIITPSLIMGRMTDFVLGIGITVGYTKDMAELLSGVGPTSDWTMIAHLVLLYLLIEKPPEAIVILGDDCTIIGDFRMKNSILYERQEQDDKAERTLGLTCGKLAHPVYENVSVDNAKKAFDIIIGQPIKNHMEYDDRKTIAELFTGEVQGVPLLDLLEKMPPDSGVYSPKEMISKYLNLDIT